jgi:hypothetical protein
VGLAGPKLTWVESHKNAIEQGLLQSEFFLNPALDFSRSLAPPSGNDTGIKAEHTGIN